jgi:glycosyltransferase involved in cell wall biosynthesis
MSSKAGRAVREALQRLNFLAPSPRSEIRRCLEDGGTTAAEVWFERQLGAQPHRAQALSKAMFEELRGHDPATAILYAQRALARGADGATSRKAPKIAARLARIYARDGRLHDALALAKRFPQAGRKDGSAQRWQAELRLLEQGWPLPERRSAPSYEPVAGRVLYLLHFSLPYRSAGYAIRTQGLLSGLRAGGRDVIGVTRPGFPDPKRDTMPAAVPSEERIGDVVYRRLLEPQLCYETTPLDRYIERYIGHVDTMARDLRPAILHAASNFVHGVTANVVAARLGVPSVYEVRGLWELTALARHPGRLDSDLHAMWTRMETEVATGATAVVAITAALKAELVARGVPDERITVVPNAVDTRRFTAREPDQALAAELGLQGRTVIGYVGSLTDYEGLDHLLEAAAWLEDRRGGDFGVLIVGDGPALPGLRKQADALRLGDLVAFTGRVPHDQVERYYSLIDIAPFPRKPLRVCELVSPLKPFEAMAMSKVVAVSSVAALAEIVTDDVTGLVYRKGDVDDLARVLDRLLDDGALRARLGQAAAAWVRRERDWGSICRRLTDLYDELMSRGGGGGSRACHPDLRHLDGADRTLHRLSPGRENDEAAEITPRVAGR